MRAGLSDPGYRIRVQTTGSCFGPMAEVVSVSEKAGCTRQVSAGKMSASEPSRMCRKRRDVVETGLQLLARDEVRGTPVDCPSDGRHQDGMSPAQALCGTWEPVTSMPRETSKWRTHEEPSTEARRRGGRVRGSDEVW